MLRIGLISDTHGLLRPEALAALRGCDHLIHAGDIGKPEILKELTRLAPLTVVRGNNDTQPWAAALPEQVELDVGGVRIQVLHDLAELAPEGPARLARVVVSGHSHKPKVQFRDGVLLVNPGSAGPRRFSLPICVGELWLAEGGISAHLRPLLPA